MSKNNRKFYLLLVVVALFVAQLACTGVDTDKLRKSVDNVNTTIVEKAGDTIQKVNANTDVQAALDDFAKKAPGSGCVTYDIYDAVTGSHHDSTLCK